MRGNIFFILFLSVIGYLVFPLYGQRAQRMCAEWEPAFGTLIRWPLGIPSELVVELAKDDSLYITVASRNQENDARTRFSSWGVNLDHCVFIRTKTNTHWTRDWGPHCTFDTQGIGGILDPIFKGYPHVKGCLLAENPEAEEFLDDYFYYRFSLSQKYEDDDKASSFLAKQLNWPHRALPTYLTGGNVMVDGYNSAISTELMLEENASIVNEDEFRKHARDYMGVTNFHIVSNPEIQGIQHIDCYAKFLDEETILIKEVAKNNPEYKCVERLVAEIKLLKNCFGRPYKIVRILCGPYKNSQVAAYTNSLFLNKKVLVPLFNISTDATALETFRKAMPGYKVIGIKYPHKWYYYDALHCRTMAIFDRFMLRISHRPLEQEINTQTNITIRALIDDRSEAGLMTNQCQVFWREKGTNPWQKIPFQPSSGLDSMIAEIPAQASGTSVEYYLTAADSSGRTAYLPRSAPDWSYSFKVIQGTPINPDNHKTVAYELRQVQVGLPNSPDKLFFLVGKSPATLLITDILGRKIRTLMNNTIARGSLVWDGKNDAGFSCPTGIYYMVLTTHKKSTVYQFILAK